MDFGPLNESSFLLAEKWLNFKQTKNRYFFWSKIWRKCPIFLYETWFYEEKNMAWNLKIAKNRFLLELEGFKWHFLKCIFFDPFRLKIGFLAILGQKNGENGGNGGFSFVKSGFIKGKFWKFFWHFLTCLTQSFLVLFSRFFLTQKIGK